MRHTLLEVVNGDEVVCIARLKTVSVEELLHKLHVAYVSLLAELLMTQAVVKGGEKTEGLEYPAQVFIQHLAFFLKGFLGDPTRLIEHLAKLTFLATLSKFMLDNIGGEALCHEVFKELVCALKPFFDFGEVDVVVF